MTVNSDCFRDATGSLDRRRFERLMGETARKARTMAFHLTMNASDAEDLLQETYLKAWRGFASYVPGRPFLNWLLRIMQRVNLDIRRRANPVRRADSLQALAQGLDGEPQELAVKDLSPLPDEAVMRDALRADLLDAIYELPDVYRKAILLCDLEGHTYSEIAELEATTIGTIRSRIHRGRRLLRESILRRQSLAGEEVESLCLN